MVSLVAQGATNREVAERLYLSPYTVNSHLRHVFTKLGIRSRVELPPVRQRAGCRPNVVDPGDARLRNRRSPRGAERDRRG